MPSIKRGVRNGTPFVVVPEGNFIPVPLYKLIHTLVNKGLSDDKERRLFLDFARRLESVYRNRWYDEYKSLKRSFSLFSPHLEGRDLLDLKDATIDAEEDAFLDKFHQMMLRGNYLMLSQSEYDMAMEEDYMFNVRATVKWNKLDSSLFSRFLERHEGELSELGPGGAASILKHSLIYHRGVGCDRVTAPMMMEKIDMMFYRAQEALSSIMFFWRKRESQTPEELRLAAEAAAAADEGHVQVVERRNVRSLLSLGNLLRPLRMQEPTFKQIIILYRPVEPLITQKNASLLKTTGVVSHADQNRRRVARRPIYIKSFVDVPMADMEMVLPEKEIQMNPVDLIKLVVALLGAFIAVYVKLTGDMDDSEQNENAAFATLALMVSYVVKLVLQFNTQNQKYNLMVTQSIYKKSLDNHDGVMLYLVDSVLEQELKESLLAYFFLWREGPKTMEELDEICESFLRSECDEKVDFEVDDALEKLQRDGFVKYVHGKVRSVPITMAIQQLDTIWAGVHTTKSAPCPYCLHLK